MGKAGKERWREVGRERAKKGEMVDFSYPSGLSRLSSTFRAELWRLL